MVQSGDDYREKNRIRLQRFYEKQKRQGKKRVSSLVSDEAYRLLTDQKDQAGESISVLVDQAVMVAYGEQGIPDIVSDEAYALLMDAKEHTGDSMSTLIDRAVKAAFGYEDFLDIDDPALNEDVIANFEGPSQDDTGLEPGAIEDAVNAMGGPAESIEQDQADAQGDDTEEIELDITLDNPDPETDDAALVDQEPDTATDDTTPEQVPVKEILPQQEPKQVKEILPEPIPEPPTDEPEPQGEPVKESLPQREKSVVETLPQPNTETPTDKPDTQDPDIIPDCTGKEITIEERDKYLLLVAEALPGKENIQNRVDLLNEKSVPVIVKAGKHGGTWDKKKFSNNLRLAKKRLEPVTDDTANLPNNEHDQTHDTTTDAKAPVESSEADGTDLGDQIPDCTGRTIDRQDRDEILVQVAEAMPDKSQAQDRVTLLNAKGVPVSVKPGQYGGEWTRKKFTDNLRFAKKRLGIE